MRAQRPADRSRGRRASLAAAVLTTLLLVGPAHGRAEGAEIGPETDLCSSLQTLAPGVELVLRSGHYRAGCVVARGGTPGARVVIRSADGNDPARLVAPPGAVSVLSIRASDVTLRGLHFGPTAVDVDGVRVVSGQRVSIDDCQFSQMGGVAVVAGDASLRSLAVRRNQITDSTATAMSFGCRDGISCSITGLVIQGNLIRAVTSHYSQIGYGVVIHVNSAAIIRDNTILDTKGPGIMVQGSVDLSTASLIERNFVRGSRTSSGIVLGGGPAVVRNNIATHNFEAGITLENYMRRGLLRGIVVAHNTVYANREAGLAVPGRSPLEATFLNNAIHAMVGTPLLPHPRAGLRMNGNLDCSWAPCFANAEALDFSPFAGSLLAGPAPIQLEPGLPTDDFFATPRATPPAIGAVDRPSGPVRLGLRP